MNEVGPGAEVIYRELLFDTFAFELRLGHRLGFVTALASPRIAGLLGATGQIERDPRGRATDTGLFMYSMVHHGLDSPVGRRAVERIKAMHSTWPIRNDDYVWVLGTFFLPGLDVVDRYGWRPLSGAERQAVVDWHRELGTGMGVRDIPATAAAFAAWSAQYERENLRASPAGRRLAAAILEVAVQVMPRPLRRPGTRMMAALLPGPVRAALDLPAPGPAVRFALLVLFRARALLRASGRRWGGRDRRGSWFDPGAPRQEYPNGYTVDDLGPKGAAAD